MVHSDVQPGDFFVCRFPAAAWQGVGIALNVFPVAVKGQPYSITEQPSILDNAAPRAGPRNGFPVRLPGVAIALSRAPFSHSAGCRLQVWASARVLLRAWRFYPMVAGKVRCGGQVASSVCLLCRGGHPGQNCGPTRTNVRKYSRRSGTTRQVEREGVVGPCAPRLARGRLRPEAGGMPGGISGKEPQAADHRASWIAVSGLALP